jgi:hypothetical protein
MYPQQPSQPVSYNSDSSGGKSRLTTIGLVVLLVISLAFGGWAFTKMQSYKDVSDKKISVAVGAAVNQAKQSQKAQDALDAQSPYKVFKGSPTYGSVTFDYPKTWSAYVDTSNQSEPINGYFHPGEVPGIQTKTAYALRVELLSTEYSQVLQGFSSAIQQGKATAKAYVPPKLSGVANVQPGTLITGQINSQDQTQNGRLLVIKVRDKTLEVYTESTAYLNEFNTIVLTSLSFVP